MRDPACNRGPASIGTSESDPRPVCGPGVYLGPGFYPKFYILLLERAHGIAPVGVLKKQYAFIMPVT